MEKQTKIEMTLDVAGWITERPRIMGEIEVRLHELFVKHRILHGDERRTGVFHVELSLPSAEREVVTDNFGTKHEQVLNAVKSQGYYCCTAPFGEHEVTCKNYVKLICTRPAPHQCEENGPCNGLPRVKE